MNEFYFGKLIPELYIICQYQDVRKQGKCCFANIKLSTCFHLLSHSKILCHKVVGLRLHGLSCWKFFWWIYLYFSKLSLWFTWRRVGSLWVSMWDMSFHQIGSWFHLLSSTISSVDCTVNAKFKLVYKQIQCQYQDVRNEGKCCFANPHLWVLPISCT